MSARYCLEIYLTDDLDTPAVRFDSDTPLVAINNGDLINPMTWPDPVDQFRGKVLRVQGVEHLFWKADGGRLRQKSMVFAAPVDDLGETRGPDRRCSCHVMNQQRR
jgi:hypothetical protein